MVHMLCNLQISLQWACMLVLRVFLASMIWLKKRKKYDKIKENYAIENKINLLIIPYWDFDKVEEILNENIKRKCE